MSFINYSDPVFGTMLLGDTIFGDGIEVTYSRDDDNSDLIKPRRSQFGWGHFSERAFSRSYEYKGRIISEDSSQVATITFNNFSGGLVGELRTDIRYPLIEDIKFTIDKQGSSDFSMTLNRLPEFPLIPGSTFYIKIGSDPTSVFAGYLEYDEDQGTKKDRYVIQGYGFRKQLKDWVRVPEDSGSIYPFGLFAGEIVDDIMQNIVQPNTNIIYDQARIDLTAGTPIANQLDFARSDVQKVFDSLAKLAGCVYGVDGTGTFYFEPRNQATVKTWIIGDGMGAFDVKRNTSTVRNSIVVKRSVGRGSGGNGYEVAGIYNDDTSIAKYGFRELEYKIPGFFGDDEADLIGDEILQQFKDPTFSAQMKKILIRSTSDFLDIGNHRFIMPVEDYLQLLVEDEDATDWTKTGAGDLVLSNDTDLVVQGASSLKLEFTSALGDEIELPVDFKGDVISISMWVYSTVQGQILTFGFGLSNYTENTNTIVLPAANRWYRWSWNVESQLQKKISTIGFELLLNSAGSIYIDGISATLRGQRHYIMEFNRSTYTFGTGTQTADAEFGELPPKNSDYISSLIQQTQENSVGNTKR